MSFVDEIRSVESSSNLPLRSHSTASRNLHPTNETVKKSELDTLPRENQRPKMHSAEKIHKAYEEFIKIRKTENSTDEGPSGAKHNEEQQELNQPAKSYVSEPENANFNHPYYPYSHENQPKIGPQPWQYPAPDQICPICMESTNRSERESEQIGSMLVSK